MAGVFRTGYQALANAVWSAVGVGSRTVTVTTNSDKTGYSVSSNGDKTGYSVSSVSDKTGYSLASLAALVRIQSNNISLGPGETSKAFTLGTAVASGKAFVVNKGLSADTTAGAANAAAMEVRLSHSTTQVTATRGDGSGNVTVEFDVVEFL
jgi:hypothetical protein